MKNIPLSDRCKEIILGSLLGDGSLKIHKPYRNARFSFRHSIRQKEYFFWKVKELKEISSDKHYWKQGKKGKDGWGGEKLRFQSLALESLTELYHLTHKKNIKGRIRIRRRWLNMMTPLSLMIWWLDDGSLVADTRQGVFCTDGFSYDEVKIIQRWLKNVWKVRTAIGKVKRRGNREHYRLWIRSSEELKKFLQIILPYIPIKSMLYKVLILYKDSQFQQRWISEVVKLSKFSEKEVKKCILERKSRKKHFRE